MFYGRSSCIVTEAPAVRDEARRGWQAPIYYLCFNKTISRHPLEPRGLLLCSGGGKVSKTPLFLKWEKRVLFS